MRFAVSFLSHTLRLPKNPRDARNLSQGFEHAVFLGKALPGMLGWGTRRLFESESSLEHTFHGFLPQRELIPRAAPPDGRSPDALRGQGTA